MATRVAFAGIGASERKIAPPPRAPLAWRCAWTERFRPSSTRGLLDSAADRAHDWAADSGGRSHPRHWLALAALGGLSPSAGS
jgi:hypothetical protein